MRGLDLVLEGFNYIIVVCTVFKCVLNVRMTSLIHMKFNKVKFVKQCNCEVLKIQ